MNRQAMREKVLGEMVVARDLEIARLSLVLERVSRLCAQQGDKILELLELKEAFSHFSVGMLDGRAVSVERVRLDRLQPDATVSGAVIADGAIECQ